MAIASRQRFYDRVNLWARSGLASQCTGRWTLYPTLAWQSLCSRETGTDGCQSSPTSILPAFQSHLAESRHTTFCEHGVRVGTQLLFAREIVVLAFSVWEFRSASGI